MTLTLDKLPNELLHLVLQCLPLSDLLTFARTSKSNYDISMQTLTTLDLAIFPRRIHSLLAFFDSLSDEDEDDDESQEDPPISRYWTRQSTSDKSLYQIGLITPNDNRPSLSRSNTPPSLLTLGQQGKGQQSPVLQTSPRFFSKTSTPPTPLSLRTAEITSQNALATMVLMSPSLAHLRNLTLRIYDLNQPSLAATIATQFPTLTNLSLEFSHPYIHDTTLPAKYWRDTVPTGSPIWNILSGVGSEQANALRLRNLRTLTLSRSGITSFQLRHWIEANPELRELRLSLCRGVDAEFVRWLADYIGSGTTKLEVIRLTDCALLDLRRDDDATFEPIDRLARSGVTDLSLRGCKLVSEPMFLRRAPRWAAMGISRIVSPRGTVFKPGKKTTRAAAGAGVGIGIGISSTAAAGSVSPALTVSDDDLIGDVSGMSFFEKVEVEVDPPMAL